jgi:hypothetical protein
LLFVLGEGLLSLAVHVVLEEVSLGRIRGGQEFLSWESSDLFLDPWGSLRGSRDLRMRTHAGLVVFVPVRRERQGKRSESLEPFFGEPVFF